VANNITILDANGNAVVLAALDTGSVYTPRHQLFDGTNVATIAAASTAAAAADPSLVVALSPNANAGASSLPIQGAAAQGATRLGSPLLCGATFTTTPATITTGQVATLQTDNVQNLLTKSKIWDGTSVAAMGSAANVALTSAANALLTTPPGMWSVYHVPAAATQATATKAAGAAGVRHICTSLSATVSTVGTAQTAALILNLRDGATGAGTVLWSTQISLPVSTTWQLSLPGLFIPGTAATAMTIEFSAANATASFASVQMTGVDTI
jgi:hypothetical protein